MEGYNINNEELDEPFESYDKFATEYGMNNWVWAGLKILSKSIYAHFLVEKYKPELYKKIEDWRAKYLDKWKEVDYDWQVFNVCGHDIY